MPAPDRLSAASRFDRRLVAPMLLGAALNPINSTVIAVGLVPIGVAFGAGPSQTAWLISALYLATAIGQPVMGRLIDALGPRRVFLAGVSLTGVAGCVGALAPALWVLVGARVILGLGTCAGYPAAMSLIRSEAQRTGQDSPAGVLTLLAVSTQTVAVIGPSLGGAVIGLAGWRATFLINLPLAVGGIALGLRFLPRPAPLHRSPVRVRELDPIGAAWFGGSLVTLLLFLVSPSPGAAWLLAASAVALAAFIRHERMTAVPFIDVAVLATNRPLMRTYVRAVLSQTLSYAFLYGYAQWLEAGRGLSPTLTGALLLPAFATGIAVSLATGRRAAVRGKLYAGAVAQVAFSVALLALDRGSGLWLLALVSIIAGFPAVISLANQTALYHQAEPARIASSAGLLRTASYIGAIVAAAATGSFFRGGADSAGLHHLALLLVVVGVLFAAVTATDASLGAVGARLRAALPT